MSKPNVLSNSLKIHALYSRFKTKKLGDAQMLFRVNIMAVKTVTLTYNTRVHEQSNIIPR